MKAEVNSIGLEVEPREKEPPLICGECRKVGTDIRTDELIVFVKESVYDKIHKHALEGDQYEVGGALIGDYYKFCSMRFVEITHVRQVDGHNASAVDFTFPAQFWLKEVHPFLEEELNEESDERYLLIGTYHTHPGLSVFLSNTDIKFVQNLFNNPWNVTMVVDHISEDEGVFFCRDRKISKKSGFWIYQPMKHLEKDDGISYL